MTWTTTTRETGLVEHVCEHGCGHPDPESAKKVAERYQHYIDTWLSHGCDGCCGREDFPGAVRGNGEDEYPPDGSLSTS